jgi:peptidoglycan/xylan/chitin deacetylase (PgdA/CDA1 family)
VATKLDLKRFVARPFGHLPPPGQRDIVLLYHSVGDGPWAVRTAQFRAQMEWLGIVARVVSLEELLTTERDAPLRVAVTFDDGYASLFGVVRALARDVRLRPTMFLNTGLIGRNRRCTSEPRSGHYPEEEFLVWDEVEQLQADGWTVGSHGVTHLDFTRADDDVVRAQLRQSKTTVERNVSVPCDYFAYTWGRHSRHLQELVAEAGYLYAFAGVHAAVGSHCNPMTVPRINVSQEYSFDDFKAIIRGDWDYLGWLQRAKMASRCGVGLA